jgi:hypothetical protein
MTRRPSEPNHRRERASELLATIAADPAGGRVTIGEITTAFGVRAHGVVLLLAAMVGFLPSPVGAGTLSGGLALVAALQMLVGRERPWLPRRLRDHALERRAIGAFLERRGRWIARVERLATPRLIDLFRRPWTQVAGLVIAIHAVVIALPVPFTNYPLSALLLVTAIALIEDDGRLLLIGLTSMLAAAIAIAGIAGGLFTALLAAVA